MLKKLILLTACVLFLMKAQAQTPILNGIYVINDAKAKVTYEFFNKRAFRKISTSDTISGYITTGGSSVTFHYKKPQDISLYDKKVRVLATDGLGYVHVHFFDADKAYVFGNGLCTLRTENYQPIVVTVADSLGVSNLTLTNFNLAKTISFSYLGYDTIDIPAAEFKGKDTNINIVLKPENSSAQSTETFVIEKNDGRELIMIGKDNKKIVLTKMN